MGYCPRCGENSALGSTPVSVSQRQRPLRVATNSTIVTLPRAADGDVIQYGGMRFRIERSDDAFLLWAIE